MIMGYVSAVRKEVQAVIYDKVNQRVLLLKFEGHNKLRLPKGGIEDGETEKKALDREIREETGLLDFRIEKKIFEYFWIDEKGAIHEVAVYTVESSIHQEVIVGCKDSGGTIIDALWLKVKEAEQRVQTQGEKEALVCFSRR